MSNSRKAAAAALQSVTQLGGYSNLVLNDIFARYELSGADRRFATAILYGTLDRMITIDATLSLFVKKGLTSVSPYVVSVLRTAVYQILYMDSVPDSAAVNEAVNLIKRSKEKYCAGFVNAVLRTFLRERDMVNNYLESAPQNIKLSCPGWIYSSLCKDYGEQTAIDFLTESFNPPPMYLRVNTLKISAADLADRLGHTCVEVVNDNCLKVKTGFDIEKNDCYKEGLFFAEGISSQFAAQAAVECCPERLLDVCSAPGGKSFSAAIMMQNKKEVISCDIHPHRVELIRKGANRLGITNIKPLLNDATVFNKSLGLFDSVLCDVPCSGLGVISRKPDIKYKKIEGGIEDVQFNILKTSSQYVKSGGRLVYSTCTLRKAENENIVQRFLSEFKDFERDTSSYTDRTFFPQTDNTDGFFISVLKRK